MSNGEVVDAESGDADPGLLGLEYLNTFESYPTKNAKFTLIREGLLKAQFVSECRVDDIETVEETIDEWITAQTFETDDAKYGFIARKFGPPDFPDVDRRVQVEFVYYIEPTAFP